MKELSKLHFSGKQKTVIIYSKEPSFWSSCNSILDNLITAYRNAYGSQLMELEVNSSRIEIEAWNVANQIHRTAPKRIVFLSHLPHPLPFLRALHFSQKTKRNYEFDFHLFGDFTLNAAPWLQASEFLKGKSVRFYAASSKQQQLVSRFFSEENVFLLPFPIDSKKFTHFPKVRIRARKKFGISDAQKLILYSGRISSQKNVDLLIHEALPILRNKPETVLFIAGRSDDFGAPMFGWNQKLNEYAETIKLKLLRNESGAAKRIQFLGQLDDTELLEAYAAADVFCSLSLHHDEDFGMAPAEAACTGLPILLTDWGGYRDFVSDEKDGYLVPVILGQGSWMIAREGIQSLLTTLLKNQSCPSNRSDRANRFRDKFGIPAVQAIVDDQRQVSAPCFSGHKPLLEKLAFYSLGKENFFQGNGKSIYNEIYQSYGTQ